MDVTQEPQLVLERNDIITSDEFGAEINGKLAYSIKKSLLAKEWYMIHFMHMEFR